MYAHERLREAPRQDGPKLSPRERECLSWLMHGHRTKDIAQRLNLSAVAVELYLKNARTKLGAKTREEAVAKAILLRIIEP
jgi:DNA-binding CsgD family transcriptional regulator